MEDKAAFGANTVSYDTDLFTSKKDKYAGYVTSIGGGVGGEDEEDDDNNNRMDIDDGGPRNKSLASFTAPKEIMREMMNSHGDGDEGKEQADPMHAVRPSRKIADREGEYRAQRLNRQLSPERKDAFDPSNNVNGKKGRENLEKER